MNVRPILFSATMVRALLDGSKTQTRRIVKPRPDWAMGKRCMLQPNELAGEVNQGEYSNCPYGQPGDQLWVRETWWHDEEDNAIIYRADPDSSIVDLNKHETGLPKYNWRPSIFMPRCASRITLEITGVRVEHLQDISEADAAAEGARECDPVSGREVLLAGPSQRGSFRLHYREIWESINGPGSWDKNPWVWVIEFKRVMS